MVFKCAHLMPNINCLPPCSHPPTRPPTHLPTRPPTPLFDCAPRWRLDRDDISSTDVKLRANLFALMRPEDGRAARLRELVVGLAPPQAAPLVRAERCCMQE